MSFGLAPISCLVMFLLPKHAPWSYSWLHLQSSSSCPSCMRCEAPKQSQHLPHSHNQNIASHISCSCLLLLHYTVALIRQQQPPKNSIPKFDLQSLCASELEPPSNSTSGTSPLERGNSFSIHLSQPRWLKCACYPLTLGICPLYLLHVPPMSTSSLSWNMSFFLLGGAYM